MREMEFTIENTEALRPGMEVNVTEGVLPSSYYYIGVCETPQTA